MKSVALLLAVVLVSHASVAAPPPQSQPTTVIATVTNSIGQYVAGLKPADFIVEEDGVRQSILNFSEDSDVPISLGILIDKSASMRLPVAVKDNQKVPAALLAADGATRVVLSLTKPQDEFLIMMFDDDFSVKQQFTSDRKKLTDWLYKNNKVGGATHLYKAVGEALKEIRKKAKNRKRALVVITDVHDTSSDKIEDLQSTILQQEIPVFTFGMRWDAWGVPGQENATVQSAYEVAVLRMMAANSGGSSMVVDIPDLFSDYTITRMYEFVKALQAELRGQYTLSYSSGAKAAPNTMTVRVRTVPPDLRVRYHTETPEIPAKPGEKKK